MRSGRAGWPRLASSVVVTPRGIASATQRTWTTSVQRARPRLNNNNTPLFTNNKPTAQSKRDDVDAHPPDRTTAPHHATPRHARPPRNALHDRRVGLSIKRNHHRGRNTAPSSPTTFSERNYRCYRIAAEGAVLACAARFGTLSRRQTKEKRGEGVANARHRSAPRCPLPLARRCSPPLPNTSNPPPRCLCSAPTRALGLVLRGCLRAGTRCGPCLASRRRVALALGATAGTALPVSSHSTLALVHCISLMYTSFGHEGLRPVAGDCHGSHTTSHPSPASRHTHALSPPTTLALASLGRSRSMQQ